MTKIMNRENQKLTEIDLSNVPQLERLHCEDNQLTEIDLSNVPGLVELYCSGNPLTELDIRPLKHLEYLKVDSGVRVIGTLVGDRAIDRVERKSQPDPTTEIPDTTPETNDNRREFIGTVASADGTTINLCVAIEKQGDADPLCTVKTLIGSKGTGNGFVEVEGEAVTVSLRDAIRLISDSPMNWESSPEELEELDRWLKEKPVTTSSEPPEDPAELALRATRLLVEAYDRGEERGGSVDWDDLDAAYEVALKAVGSIKDPDKSDEINLDAAMMKKPASGLSPTS